MARTLAKKERDSKLRALAALQAEWDKLRKRGVWDESKVQAWDSAASDARETGRQVHVGLICEMVVEKNSKRPASDPRRTIKVALSVRATTSATKAGTGLSSFPATIGFQIR